MRRVVIVSCVLFLSGLTHNVFADFNTNDDTAAAVLQTYYNSSGLWDGTFAGWGDAEALETVENTILRTNGQSSYLSDIATTYNDNYSGGFIDNYYDDEGWWCNAWIRAYDLTGNTTYLNMAKSIYSDIVGGWDASVCNGGLWWQKPNNYKSSISNELFLLESIRLHQRTPGDSYYLNWANAEWTWFSGTGVINGNNLINDGVDSTTCGNNGGGIYTYNQGVILAGLTDLYKETLNTAYLTKAESIANAVLNSANGLVNTSEIVTQGGPGDGSEFNGIFARYLFYLYDTDHNPAYYNFLVANANSIWANDRDGSNNLGYLWTGPVNLSMPGSHVSSMDPGAVIAKPWTTTMVYARGAGDPELNHSTGYATGTLAWACDNTSSQTFMQWGPYVSYLSAGSHTVHFRLASSVTNCSPVSLLTLQITSNSGTVTQGSMNVPWAAFVEANKPQDFAVSYTDNTANDPLEFRVIWNAVPGTPKVTLSDITVDGNYNWTAANLTHDIGRLDGVNDWEADSVKDSASGYMIRGPGTAELGNANCQAVFEMKVDNFNWDNNQVATLSVVDVDTGTTVASQNVTRNQFNTILFQDFTLNFTATLGHHYDYRVYYDVFNNSPRLTVRGIYTSILSANPAATPTAIACASGGTFGNTVSGTGGYNLGGQIDCAKYNLAQAMTVTSISIYMGAGTSGNGVLGIYSDSGGPANLLVQSSAQPLFAGWNTVGVTPTVLTAGNYWLSGSFTGNAVFDYSNSNGGTMSWTNYTYSGTLPCTVGGLTGYGWLMSIYASGCLQPTPTMTQTHTSTDTATNSPTCTPTASSTATLTDTATLGETATNSATNTVTNSPSSTPSETETSSATSTNTITPMPTSTSTLTPVSSYTSTSTQTVTFTGTSTATRTATNSATSTATNSATSTATNTATKTSSQTATSTCTASSTPTASFTSTSTATNRATNTATVTRTQTSTWTASSSPTQTGSSTATSTLTATATSTGTSTPKATNTRTATCTATVTNTPAMTKAVIYPNPATGDRVEVAVPKANPSEVTIEIFTISFREIATVQVSQVVGNTVLVPLYDKRGTAFANGLYYFRVTVDGQKYITKLLVLR